MHRIVTLGSGLLLLCSATLAEDAARLRALESFYNSLSEASCTFACQIEVPQRRLRNRSIQQMDMRRPNQLVMRTTEGQGGLVQSDGKQLYLGIPDLKRYTAEAAPESFQAWVQGANQKQTSMPTPGGDVVLQLLGGDVLKSLGAEPGDVRHVAVEDVDGNTCDRFELKLEGRRVQLWIGKEQPWLWRIRQVFAEGQVDVAFRNWQKQLSADADFTTKPGDGMQLVKQLQPQRRTPRPVGGQRSGGRLATGADAIPFQSELLGGGEVNLSDHVGKDIIVLDFWATWCKPCLMGMPIVAEETAKRKDKGVVFYAVNLRESDKKIQALMDAKGWKFPVALDRQGSIGQKYGARSIPLTVIIGRDGKVAHVHTGFSPGLQQRLSSELDALIAK